MATGSHLKVKSMGDAVLGVKLNGTTKTPEPESFRVVFPGGSVDITRCDDNSYWVHIARNIEDRCIGQDHIQPGYMIDGRVDIEGQHSGHELANKIDDPMVEHVAIRVALSPAS